MKPPLKGGPKVRRKTTPGPREGPVSLIDEFVGRTNLQVEGGPHASHAHAAHEAVDGDAGSDGDGIRFDHIISIA